MNHPLVLSLIYEKWEGFGRVVFYSKFALYAFFLFFLTGYVLVTPPLLPREMNINGKLKCVQRARPEDKMHIHTIVFFSVGRYIVIILSVIQILLEVRKNPSLE